MPVYLELFHGRVDPNEEMDDWGEKGPILGPLDYFQTTYQDFLHVQFLKRLPDGTTKVEDASITCTPSKMIFYDGMYYGDWSVFDGEVADSYRADPTERLRFQQFDEAKTEIKGS